VLSFDLFEDIPEEVTTSDLFESTDDVDDLHLDDADEFEPCTDVSELLESGEHSESDETDADEFDDSEELEPAELLSEDTDMLDLQ